MIFCRRRLRGWRFQAVRARLRQMKMLLSIPTETYWMTKYPITNAQYAKFVEAGGYRERQWWTDAGWQQHEKDLDRTKILE